MLRKLLLTVLIFLPLSLYAVGSNTPTAQPFAGGDPSQNFNADNLTTPYNPMVSPDENASSSTATLNSNMFGLKGPLSINTTYSEDYGVILKGQWTQGIGEHNAYSLIAEGGAKQYRFNATWATMLTQNQMIKVSLERLAQKMDFSFQSGDSRDWVAQNGVGVGYQYLLHKGWLSAVNLTGFLSKAESKNLSSIDYIGQDGNLYRNDRRIAGGEQRSVKAGMTFLPTRWTQLDLSANYQSVTYPMRYEADTNNSHGFGFGVTAHQIVSKHLALDVDYEQDQTQKTIGGDVDILLPSPKGTSLALKLGAKHIKGENGASSDNEYTAGLDFHWGVGHSTPDFSAINLDSSLGDIQNFAKTPAIYMNQVLAVKDEQSVRLNQQSVESRLKASHQAVTQITIPVDQKKPIDVKLDQYLPKGSSLSTSEFSAEGLPSSLHYDEATREITGTWPKLSSVTANADNPKQAAAKNSSLSFSLMPDQHTPQPLMLGASAKKSVDKPITVTLVGAGFDYVSVNPNGPKSISFNKGSTVKILFQDDKQGTSNLFYYLLSKDPNFSKDYRLQYSWVGAQPSGLSCALTNDKLYLQCSGSNPSTGTYTMSITFDGYAVGTIDRATISNFKFTINNPAAPPVRNTTAAPGNLTLAPGAALKYNSKDINYADYYTVPVSNPLKLDATKLSQLSVSFTPTVGTPLTPVLLKASNLGEDHKTGSQFIQLNGTSLQGSLPSNTPSGLYTITALPYNDIGNANTPLSFGIYVTGPPVYNNQNPAAQNKNGGEQLTADFTSSFKNPQGETSTMALDLSQSTVSFNNDPAMPFSASPFHGALNVSNNMQLTGTLPSTGLQVGTYHFHMKASNARGPSTQASNFDLTIDAVPEAPKRTTKQVPAQGDLSPGGNLQGVDYNDGYYTNNSSVSGPLTINGNSLSEMSVSFLPTTSASPDAPTLLQDSNLGVNHQSGGHYLSLSGLVLSGSVPSNTPSGEYTISARPKNNAGPGDSAVVYSFYVKGPPIYNGTSPTPAAEDKDGGGTLDDVNFAQSFTTPHGTQTPAIDLANSTVDFNGGTPEPISASLFNGHLSVSNNTTLTGTIPETVEVGAYHFHIKASNEEGVSTSAATFTLNIGGVPGLPTWNSQVIQPANQIKSAGDPVDAVHYETLFTNPPNSGDMHLDQSAQNTLNVDYQAPGESSPSSPTSLDGSHLSALTLSGTGTGYRDMTLGGTLSSSTPSGTYTISARAQNDKGVATSGPSWTLYIKGVPVAKQNDNPPTPVQYHAGDAITTVDYDHYFVNPPDSDIAPGQPIAINAASTDEMAVCYNATSPLSSCSPGAGQTLTASALGQDDQGHLSVSQASLEGTVPHNAPAGFYTISVHPHNAVAGQAAEEKTFVLEVTGTTGPPQWNQQAAGQPQDQTKVSGAPIVIDAVDYAPVFYNPLNSGDMYLDASDVDTLNVEYQAPGEVTPSTPTDLANSHLSALALSGTGTGYRDMNLAGTLPANTPSGTYTITATPKNDKGKAILGPSWTLYLKGVPVAKQGEDPPTPVAYHAGETISSLDYSNYFVNPPESDIAPGEPIAIDADNKDELAVCYNADTPAATCAPADGQTLANSSLGQDNDGHLSVNVATLEGKVPLHTPVGYYTITVHPHNSVAGQSVDGKSFVLHVSGTTAPPIYQDGENPVPTPFDQGGTVSNDTYDFGGANFYVNPPLSGDMELQGDKVDSVSVEYQSPTDADFGPAEALNASRLYDGGNGVVVDASKPTALSGKIPTNTTSVNYSGTYRFALHMANTLGGLSTGDGPEFIVQVKGVPVARSSNPTDQALAAGDTLAPIDFENYYANPPASDLQSGSAMAIDDTTTDELAVCYNATTQDATCSTGGQTLAASALGQDDNGHLSVSGATIDGTIPHNAPEGYYTITVHPHNGVGRVVDAEAKSVHLHVTDTTGVPTYITGTNPNDQSIYPSNATASQITPIDFAGTTPQFYDNPPNSGPLTISETDPSELSVAFKAPKDASFAAATDLKTSSLGEDHDDQGHIAVSAHGGNTAYLSGNVPLSAPGGTYQLTIHASNTKGLSTGAGPVFNIIVEGSPYLNTQDPNQPDATVDGGQSLNLDYSENFQNPPNSGALTLSDSDQTQIEVCHPATGGTCTTLAASPLGSSSGQSVGDFLTVSAGSAVIAGKIPDNAPQGTYLFKVRGANDKGTAPAAQTSTMTLTVDNVPGTPAWDNNPVPHAEQIKAPGEAITTVNYQPLFTNPVNSGAMYMNSSLMNTLKIEYQAPGQTTTGAPQSLSDSPLSALSLGGQSDIDYHDMALSGTLDANTPSGTYTITATPRNDKGVASTGPSWTLYVTGQPIKKTGTDLPAPPATQTIGIGQSMTSSVDFGQYYNNPPQSGGLSLSSTDAGQLAVAFTPDGGSQEAAKTLSDSNVSSLQLGNAVLSGTVPNVEADEGEYDFTAHAANTIGIANDSVPFKLVVSGPPKNPTNPADTTVPTDLSLTTIDYQDHFTNPVGGGTESISPTDTAQMQVDFTPTVGSDDNNKSLSASGLNNSYAIDGTQLKPKTGTLAAGTPTGIYTVTTHLRNTWGNATSPSVWHLTVPGAPVRNTNVSVTNLSGAPGQSVSQSFDSGSTAYYVNPTGADTMSIDPSQQGQAQVETPSGTTMAFNSSPLHPGSGDQLSISGMTLSGKLPANLSDGTYKLTIKPVNNYGAASTATTINIAVATTPEWNDQSPDKATYYVGQAFNPDSTGLKLLSYFKIADQTPTSLYFDAASTQSIALCDEVNPTDPEACHTLSGSGLNVYYNNNSTSPYIKSNASGGLTLPTAYKNQTSHQFQLWVWAKSSSSSTSRSSNPFKYVFTLIGPPIVKDNTIPQITVNGGGHQIDPVDLSAYFNNDNNGGDNNQSFSDASQVQVSYNGGSNVNFNSSALYNNGNGLSLAQDAGDGDWKITGTLPANLVPGTYRLTIYSKNNAGVSATAKQLNLNVTNYSNFAPCPNLETALQGSPNNVSWNAAGDGFTFTYSQNGAEYVYSGQVLEGITKDQITSTNNTLYPQWTDVNASGNNKIRCLYLLHHDGQVTRAVGLTSVYQVPTGANYAGSQQCNFDVSSPCKLTVPSSWLHKTFHG